MPADTTISVSWETKHRLEAIVSEMTSERAERQERGRKVSMDDAVRRALDRATRADKLDRLMRKTADILYYNRDNPIMEKIYFMIVEEGTMGVSGEPAAPGGGEV